MGFKAFLKLLREVFDRTIGDQPVEIEDTSREGVIRKFLGLKPRKVDKTGEDSSTPNKLTEGQPEKPFKRNWRAELHEYFVEHLLDINNVDPKGLTEKFTIA